MAAGHTNATHPGDHHARGLEFQTSSAALVPSRPCGSLWSVATPERIAPRPATDHAQHDHEDSRAAGFEGDIVDTRLRRQWQNGSCLHHISNVVLLEWPQEERAGVGAGVEAKGAAAASGGPLRRPL